MSTQPLQTVPRGPLDRLPSAARMIEAVKAVYSEGRRELDVRTEPEDVATDRDRVAAMEEVLKRALRDREERLYAQNLLAELRLHQERWLGKWLADNVNHSGGGDRRSATRSGAAGRDLPEGISKNQSSAFQRLAAMSDAAFDRYLADARDGRQEITTAGALRFSTRRPQARSTATDDAACSPSLGQMAAALHRFRDLQPLFGTIYVDPPWRRVGRDGERDVQDRDQILSIDELSRLPIKDLAADASHLHLLTPEEHLFDCQRLLSNWGFNYKCTFVIAMADGVRGGYWQVAHMFLVLGVHGQCPFKDRSIRSWAELTKGRQGEKTELIRSLLPRVSPGPYLDLFGRGECPGWVMSGAELFLVPPGG